MENKFKIGDLVRLKKFESRTVVFNPEMEDCIGKIVKILGLVAPRDQCWNHENDVFKVDGNTWSWPERGLELIKSADSPDEMMQDSVKGCITKDSNPKDAIGIKKVPFSTVPSQVVAELGLGMLEGALKYGRHNYRVIGVRVSVYYDATMRHLTAFWEGEDIDPESGLPHLIKAMSSLAVLRDAQIQDKVTDDRPPKSPAGWVAKLNDKAKEIIEKFPNPREPYTEKGQEKSNESL